MEIAGSQREGDREPCEGYNSLPRQAIKSSVHVSVMYQLMKAEGRGGGLRGGCVTVDV